LKPRKERKLGDEAKRNRSSASRKKRGDPLYISSDKNMLV